MHVRRRLKVATLHPKMMASQASQIPTVRGRCLARFSSAKRCLASARPSTSAEPSTTGLALPDASFDRG